MHSTLNVIMDGLIGLPVLLRCIHFYVTYWTLFIAASISCVLVKMKTHLHTRARAHTHNL